MTPSNIGQIRPRTPEEQRERIRQREAEQQEHANQTEAAMLADPGCSRVSNRTADGATED